MENLRHDARGKNGALRSAQGADAARYMSVKQLAARMGVTEKCAERLVEGKNPLTPYAALRLEIALGIPAKVWLEAETARRAELKERQL